jgi:BlaI family transcriptional regulator, penicillinase repressor
MAKRQTELSKSEWSVMNICWKLGESPTRAIFEESLKDKEREYQTIKTMLDRLVDKGFLSRRKFGPLVMFTPAVPREKSLAKAIDGFVDNVLDNALAPMFTHFAKGKKLSSEDIKALEEIISKNKED